MPFSDLYSLGYSFVRAMPLCGLMTVLFDNTAFLLQTVASCSTVAIIQYITIQEAPNTGNVLNFEAM